MSMDKFRQKLCPFLFFQTGVLPLKGVFKVPAPKS